MPWSFYDKNGNLKQAAASAINPAVELNTPTTTVSNSGAFATLSAWTNETYKTVASMHAAGVDGKLVAPVAGRYLIVGDLIWSATPSNAAARVLKNGVTDLGGGGGNVSTTIASADTQAVVTALLNAGDYVELQAAQGSLTNPLALAAGSHFSMIFMDGAITSPVAFPASLVGQEVAYAEQTATVTATSSVATSGVTVVTSPAFTADGVSSYRVEFYSPAWRGSDSTNIGNLYLWQDGAAGVGTQLGIVAQTSGATVSNPVRITRKITPAAGSRTFTIAICDGGGATVHAAVLPGTGGAGNFMPAFIRITKAS